MLTIFGHKKVASSSLSDFVQNYSSADKKKLYTKVIRKATESQNEILREAKAIS
ncbi:MAG: hypothetical protein ACI9LM_004014 [Alteromonadaceae bacterium]|jgi:hypothetical protein